MSRGWVARTAVLVASVALVALAAAPGAIAAEPPPVFAPAAACWEHAYADPPGDSFPDVLTYSLSFDCPTSTFTFSVFTSASFPFVREQLRIWTATGAGPSCNGFDRMVAGDSIQGTLVGTVYRTPTCARSTWIPISGATFIHVNSQHLALRFSPSDIGTASFRWWGETPIASTNRPVDRFPDAGAHAVSGVPYFPTATSGYWLADSAGGVHAYGNASYHGDLRGIPLAAPIVGMAALPQRNGYWLLGRDGGVFSFGSAQFYGSTGGIRLNQPITGLTSTHTGHGYWFVATDGGIFSYGDAAFYGSTGAIRLNRPIVGMATTPSGHGYWLVASDGGIFSFGDAAFYGSTGAIRLNRPIVGMTATKTGHGYWLVASDGGIFSFGDAAFYGSTGNLRLASPIVGMTSSPSGKGYRFVASDGGIFSFGDAPFYGSLAGTPAPPVVAMS